MPKRFVYLELKNYEPALMQGADITLGDQDLVLEDITMNGDTTIGSASSDALTINATSTVSAPLSVGVNDTGYDVNFFGATSGKKFFWDESADTAFLTCTVDVDGTITVGVDDTGYDVKLFGATAGKSLLWDESADTLIVTGELQMTAGQSIKSSVAGVVAPFVPTAVQQAISGAGAVTLTEYYTAVTNTGTDALTLADSTVVGQLKKVQMIVDPGTNSTLTFNTNATIVFADVGDFAILIWNGADWIPIELGNDADGVTAPAYTPAS